MQKILNQRNSLLNKPDILATLNGGQLFDVTQGQNSSGWNNPDFSTLNHSFEAINNNIINQSAEAELNSANHKNGSNID